MHWHKHHDGAKHFEESRRDAKGEWTDESRGTEPPNYGTFFEKKEVEKVSKRLEVAIVLSRSCRHLRSHCSFTAGYR